MENASSRVNLHLIYPKVALYQHTTFPGDGGEVFINNCLYMAAFSTFRKSSCFTGIMLLPWHGSLNASALSAVQAVCRYLVVREPGLNADRLAESAAAFRQASPGKAAFREDAPYLLYFRDLLDG